MALGNLVSWDALRARNSRADLFLSQLLSPSFASSLPSSTVTRFKTLAKEASKRLPAEARIKVLVAEFAA